MIRCVDKYKIFAIFHNTQRVFHDIVNQTFNIFRTLFILHIL